MVRPSEGHAAARISWLRAAVLGANDGIVSTASLVIGVAAASAARSDIFLAGIAGLVAGSMSMAAGEYVSVSSQADAEKADLDRERQELAAHPEREHEELASIYVDRGLKPDLAGEVAEQLMNHDALGAHARDELGYNEIHSAKPIEAALASAVTFAGGAALPLLLAWMTPAQYLIPVVAIGSLVFLGAMGALAARAGGANLWQAAKRVIFWGALAMALTAAVGTIFGTAI